MHILFAISIFCFIALLWAGFAIVRHIGLGHKSSGAALSSQPDFAHHLYAAAGETRVPRAVRRQSVRDVAAKKSWNSATPIAIQIPPSFDEERAGTINERRRLSQSLHVRASERLDWIYSNKDAGDLSDPYQPRHARGLSSAQATSNRRY